MNKFLK